MDTKFLEQYEAVKMAAGFLDLSSRGKVQLTGPDRETFLHAMITNDVQELESGRGRYATFLTPRGKMITDLYVYKLPQLLLADLPESRANETVEALQKFIVMDDVQVQDVSRKWSHFSLQGPESESLLSETFDLDRLPGEELQAVQLLWKGKPGWVIRKGDLDSTGFDLLLPAETGQAARDSILRKTQSSAVREISHDVRNVLRLERGMPWFGQDMDQTHYPMEARLEKAISFTKGCYVGQEVVAKATYIGGVSKLLSCLKFESPLVPEKGTVILDCEGLDVGRVTSSAFSPALNRPIGLGYLKKTVALPGNRLQAADPDGRLTPVEVVESFN